MFVFKWFRKLYLYSNRKGMNMRRILIIFGIPILILFLQARIHGEEEIEYKIIIQTPFQPIGELILDYPDELKREGVASRFLLSIQINNKGSVFSVTIWKSHHPKLEKKLKNAARHWKFEPFIHESKPVHAHGFVKVIFYPKRAMHPKKNTEFNEEFIIESSDDPSDKELKTVLDLCNKYCQKLSAYSLYYVCLEIINAKINAVADEFIGTLSFSGAEYKDSQLFQLMLKDNKKNSYLYDYQLIRKNGSINEKRIPLGKTGRKVSEKSDSIDAKLSYHIQPIMVPERLLSHEQRPFYTYELIDDEEIQGKKAFVINIYPKLRRTGDIQHGKVWIDKENYQILKVEMETFYMEGYEEVYEECSKYFLTPHFTLTHHYEIEKNGIMFPSRSEIRIEYSGLLATKKGLKAELDVTYSSYRFFTVDVDHNLIKKKNEALISACDKLIFKNSLRLIPCVLRYF